MVCKMTSKGQLENLTTVQGHDLTQTHHFSYHPIFLNNTNPSNLFWSLYLVSMKSYYEETAGDIWWRHATSNARCRGHRCTCQHKWLVNTTFCMFWLLRMVLTQTKMKLNLSHWLIMTGHKIDVTLGQRYKKKIRVVYFIDPVTLNTLWKF